MRHITESHLAVGFRRFTTNLENHLSNFFETAEKKNMFDFIYFVECLVNREIKGAPKFNAINICNRPVK